MFLHIFELYFAIKWLIPFQYRFVFYFSFVFVFLSSTREFCRHLSRRVVVSLTISLFVGFAFAVSNYVRRYDIYLESYLFYVFFDIKCVGIESKFIAINIDVTSLFKVCNTFNYVFI